MTVETQHPPVAHRRRLPWWSWVLLTLVAIVVVVIGLGGLNDVPVAKLPKIQLGDTQVGNELTTTVTSVSLSTTSPVTGSDLDEGSIDLVVEATVLNTTDRANLFATDLVRVLIDGVIDPDTDTPDVIELRSGGSLQFLQPRLPTKIAYVWQVKKVDVAVGDPIVIGIFQRHPVADNPLFADAQSAAEPVVRIITTVGDR